LIVALVLALSPMLDVPSEEAVEVSPSSFLGDSYPKCRSQVDADDPLVPRPGRGLDVERFEVAVEHLVDGGAGLAVAALVDLIRHTRPHPLRLGRNARTC
jgi:hypothetical protein